jgi:hypothetical protein
MKTFKRIAMYLSVVLLTFIVAGYLYIGVYLPNPDPAPAISVELTPERIERGRYLANHVSVCMDCHAVRDWSILTAPPKPETVGAGGDRFGREIGLPGEVFAKNLTPVNLANYTDGELFRAITTGIDRHDKVLFPIMPFPLYRYMAEEDVFSIIAYLRTLEPVEGTFPAAELDFPLNLIINTLGTTWRGNQQPPHPSDRIAYGEYLTTIAACADCHNPGVAGNTDPKRPFMGGTPFGLPGGILVRSANITPDPETGIGNWSRDFFIARFKAYDPEVHPLAPVSPGEFNTVMPWSMYAGMTDEDLGAIYDYLMTVQPRHNEVVRFEVLSSAD